MGDFHHAKEQGHRVTFAVIIRFWAHKHNMQCLLSLSSQMILLFISCNIITLFFINTINSFWYLIYYTLIKKLIHAQNVEWIVFANTVNRRMRVGNNIALYRLETGIGPTRLRNYRPLFSDLSNSFFDIFQNIFFF